MTAENSFEKEISKKYGPLPLYAWAGIAAGGGLLIYYVYFRRSNRANLASMSPDGYPISGYSTSGGGGGGSTDSPPATTDVPPLLTTPATASAPASIVKLFQPRQYQEATGDKTSVIGHFDMSGPNADLSQGVTEAEVQAADRVLRAKNASAVKAQEALESGNVSAAQRGHGMVIGTRSDGTPLIVYQ